MEKHDRRPRLTRRLERQYRAVLGGRGADWYWPPPGVAWMAEPDEIAGLTAAHFAARWHSRRIDLKALQLIVIKSGSHEAAYKFAREVPGANVRRLQAVVLRNGGPEDMRRFAANVPSSDAAFLEGMAVVKEIMSL